MSRDGNERFDIAGGTVTGRSHALVGRGNQDAYAFRTAGDHLVAAVCDGCGSGAHSEVGAELGARLVTALLLGRLAENAGLTDGELWDALRRDVLAALRPAVIAAGDRVSATVAELMLFTIVGVAIRGDTGVVFAAGDGVVAVDGEVQRLGPFPGDAPPYLGYGLIDAGAPGFSVVRTFAAKEVNHVLIGTDGAAALAEVEGGRLFRRLWEDERHFGNRDGIRRSLALLNREEAKPIWAERRMERKRGLLEDDATVVVVRRKPS
ncbi:MAG: protein phosphatase 2C domain-containing protein [Minicystis sp.]